MGVLTMTGIQHARELMQVVTTIDEMIIVKQQTIDNYIKEIDRRMRSSESLWEHGGVGDLYQRIGIEQYAIMKLVEEKYGKV